MPRRDAKYWPFVLFGALVLCTCLPLFASFYLEQLARRFNWAELSHQPLPVSQWWQGLLVGIATSLFGIIATLIFVDILLRAHETARWDRVKDEAGLLLIAMVDTVLTALCYGLKQIDDERLRALTAGFDSAQGSAQQREALKMRREELQALLVIDAKVWLDTKIGSGHPGSDAWLWELNKSVGELRHDTEAWLTLFGAHSEPKTLEALIDIRLRLRALDKLGHNKPLDDPDAYASWCQAAADHWQLIFKRIDELVAAL